MADPIDLLNDALNHTLRTIAGWFESPRKLGIVIVDPTDTDGGLIVCGNLKAEDLERAARMWAASPTEPGRVHVVDVLREEVSRG